MGSDVNKFHFRLVLLGSDGTGKTSILNRFLFKKFEAKHKPTVEDLFTKEFDLGSIEIKVDFLDTSGSMQFPAMRRLSITNGDAFLIVYSLDDESSFEVLKRCIAEIQEVRKHDYHEIPIVFVGNKSDLPRDVRKVPKELVSNFVYYELPRLRTKVIECSCKDNFNIETIFRAYLGLARVSVSACPGAAAKSAATARGGSVTSGQSNGRGGSAMGTIASGGSSGERGSRNNSAKKRPSSAVPPASAPAATGGAGGGQLGPAVTDPAANSQWLRSAGKASGGHGSSFRLALGVRKSCDASIVTSMRRISLSSARNSREQLKTAQELASGASGDDDDSQNSSNTQHQQQQQQQQQHFDKRPSSIYRKSNDSSYDEDDHGSPPLARAGPNQLQKSPQKSSIESILKAALQSSQSNSKLHVNNHAKPRSKSLIWRPHRKSSQSSSHDQSECRVV